MKSWLFPGALALSVHGAIAVVPVELPARTPAAEIVELSFEAPPPAPEPPPPEPPPPPPEAKVRRAPRPVAKPTPQPQPEPEPTPQPEPEPIAETPAPAPEPPPPPPPPPAPKAPARVDLGGYGSALQRAVLAHRSYPVMARRQRLEGRAMIRVVLNRQGTLVAGPELVESTGHEVLDRAALRMLQAAAPFAPLPEGYAESTAQFVIPVQFSLTEAG